MKVTGRLPISSPRGTLSAQKWGEAVHEEFNRLVNLDRKVNPKFWGETGYLNGGLATKNGSVRPAGSSWPDCGYPARGSGLGVSDH